MVFLKLDTGIISDIEIIRNLLYCFQGIDSNMIVFNQTEKQFVLKAKVSFYYTYLLLQY